MDLAKHHPIMLATAKEWKEEKVARETDESWGRVLQIDGIQCLVISYPFYKTDYTPYTIQNAHTRLDHAQATLTHTQVPGHRY
jgi:hypothetical protein